jgi:RND superfamily putative drug exporter
MHIIGPVNWTLPRCLDRVLPRLAVEAADPTIAGPATGGPAAGALASATAPDGPGHTVPSPVIRAARD